MKTQMSLDNKETIRLQKKKLKQQIVKREKKVKKLCKKLNDIENQTIGL